MAVMGVPLGASASATSENVGKHHKRRPAPSAALSPAEARPQCSPAAPLLHPTHPHLPTCRASPAACVAAQARVKAVSEIVSQLIQGVQGGADVDLNAIKYEVTAKYALQRAPKLVEIIAAVPEEWKSTLLPRYTPAPAVRCCLCSPNTLLARPICCVSILKDECAASCLLGLHRHHAAS